jgi:hypothetical protein
MLNRKTVKDLRDKLQSMVEMEGYEVTVGNASFNDDEVTFKLNLRVEGASSQAEKDLEQWAGIHNLDLTKTARIDGKTFMLSGYRRKARTKPYLMKDMASGNEYIATSDTVKMYFKKDDALDIGQEVH